MDVAAGAFDFGAFIGLIRSVGFRRRQFSKKLGVNFVSPWVYVLFKQSLAHPAIGFMHMAAVVKFAVVCMNSNIGHTRGQCLGGYMVQTKCLEARRIHQCSFFGFIYPIPSGGGGGVFARLQGLRNDVGRCFCIGYHAVYQRALACTRGAKYQGDAVGKFVV